MTNKTLFRLFAVSGLILAMLGTCRPCFADNLVIRISGPFLLCEGNNNQLLILSPNLKNHGTDTHFFPVISSNDTDADLVTGTYTLAVSGSPGKLQNDGASTAAIEHKSSDKPCNPKVGAGPNMPNIVLSVRMPNKLKVTMPAGKDADDHKSRIWNEAKGEYVSGGFDNFEAKVGLKVTLDFEDVDLTKITLAGPSGGPPQPFPVSPDHETGVLEIGVLPYPQATPQGDKSRMAFGYRAMTALANLDRCLVFPPYGPKTLNCGEKISTYFLEEKYWLPVKEFDTQLKALDSDSLAKGGKPAFDERAEEFLANFLTRYFSAAKESDMAYKTHDCATYLYLSCRTDSTLGACK